MCKCVLPMIVLLFSYTIHAQNEKQKDSTGLLNKLKEVKASVPEVKDIELIQSLQLWDVSTFENSGVTGNEKINDLYIRRGRLGVRGKLRKDLSFNVVFAYDGAGRQKNTAGNGNANDPDNHDFFLWEAFWMWTHKPMVNITAGYFRPQIGREHMTAAFSVLTFEKALTNFQTRQHFLGRNTGRETGINLGGLHLGSGWSFNYNVGIFDLTGEKVVGKGTRWFPMIASRAAITLGDPEMEKYKITYTESYYGNRKGITLGVNGTFQGETEIFKQNSFVGADLLANYRRFDLVAEYDLMYRNAFTSGDTAFATTDRVFSVKAGYNHVLKNGKIIQLTAGYSTQNAEDHGSKMHYNSLTAANDIYQYDVGVNYLLNKEKLKFNIHYVWGKKKDKASDPNFSYLGTGFQYLF